MQKTDLLGNICNINKSFHIEIYPTFCTPSKYDSLVDTTVAADRIPTIISTLSLFLLGMYIL